MKAAVIYHQGELPEYTDVETPTPRNEDEVLVKVKAVAIKHFDKSRASGKHYSSHFPKDKGKIVGGDGICLLPDGTRVYGMGIDGMLAEEALIEKSRIVKVPDGLDDETAAALPNAVIGSAMGFKFKANIKPSDVVLVNGATGFTGRVAIQIAKHYGAKKVIATGRNQKSLNELLSLGVDEIISTSNDEEFIRSIKSIHSHTPIDIIIDYLWGHTAEMIFTCLKGDGSFTNKVRYVSIGSVTGDTIQLSAAVLRSVDIQLSGSGLGSWSKEQVGKLFTEILPEMFQLAANGKLKVETVTAKMEDVSKLWNLDVPDGKRLVIVL